MIDWVTQNWEAIVTVVTFVLVAARVVVEHTATKTDDAVFNTIFNVAKTIGLVKVDANGNPVNPPASPTA